MHGTLINPEHGVIHAAIEIRAEIARLQGGFRINLWRCISEAYDVALDMVDNQETYKEFLKESYFESMKKRPKANDTSKILLSVMRFVFNAQSENAYNRAWKYAKALESSFSERVPACHIREIIEEQGGIEAMLKKAAKRAVPKKSRMANVLVPDADDVDMGIPEQQEDVENDDGDCHARVPPKAKSESRSRKVKPLKTKPRKPEKAKANGGIDNKRTTKPRKVLTPTPDHYRLLASSKLTEQLRLLDVGETARIKIRMVEHLDLIRPKIVSLKRLEP